MEKSKLFSKLTSVFLVVMLFALLVLAIYYSQNPTKTLYPGEVRDYKGENLASIADVEENAIKGTQKITLQLTGWK